MLSVKNKIFFLFDPLNFELSLSKCILFLKVDLRLALNHFYRLALSELWEGVSSAYVDWRSVRRTVDREHRLGVKKVQLVWHLYR